MNNLSSDLNIEVSRIERDVGVMDSDIYRLLSPAALLDTSDKVRAGRLSPGHSRDKLLCWLVNTSYERRGTEERRKL